MHNAIHPDRMTAAERLDEAAIILSRGIHRLRVREGAQQQEKSLDFTIQESVYSHEQFSEKDKP